MEQIVRDYIENEINYIKSDETCCGLDDGDIKDIYMLEHLSNKKIKEIAINVYYDLEEQINEAIHDYLYE